MFKVDFEKAYDKINWSFLKSVMLMKGFPVKYVDWTMSTVSNGKVAIMVKDNIGPYFNTKKV